MRLFGYYALHTLKNQIRKLLKTWVLIFLLACMLIGGAIGYGAARISELSEDAPEDTELTETAETPDTPEEESVLASHGISAEDMIELIAGAVILLVFVYEAMSADKNGSKIFLPADVNLLFPSPMQPQSVLLFRMMTQLGVAALSGIYLLAQIPNLMLNLGLSPWAALAIIATWCLTIMAGKLLQLLLYTAVSTRPGVKANLRRSVYALLILVVLGYLIYWKRSGTDYFEAAVSFFNAPLSRFIPLWGWLKGFCMFAVEGRTLAALLCLAAVALSLAALVYIIWHGKADFYEDAMAKSEETAELLQRAQSEKGTAIVRRKKERSEKIRRDGLSHGWGANIYFFKALYNRFRFAHLGFLTKTTETYLLAAAAVALLCRLVLETRSLIPVALTLAGLSFFRSLGNPLAQDTEMDYFVLIPESAWAKLFFSLLGGTANCLLDALPALLLASFILWSNPLWALAWLPFILSVDFYATTVGAFINLSVPVSAGKTLKQVVQIMFIYFGLLPDIALLAVGIATNHTAVAALVAAALNFFLGLLFFGLTPLFIDPRSGTRREDKPFAGDLTAARARFSRLGLAAFVILLTASLLQIWLGLWVSYARPAWAESVWAPWVLSFAPLYFVAMPLGLIMFRAVPTERPEGRCLSWRQFLCLIPICIFLMYAGNLLGSLVTSLLRLLLPVSAVNPLETYAASESLAWKILVMVIVGPLAEEFIFRKQLIDRMHVYGEKLAVVTSAVMFGLFHGNFSQLFYAVALGIVFGYVYLKTGALRYSALLHMLVNFTGSILGPAVINRSGLESLELTEELTFTPETALLGGYVLVILVLALLGLVLLCVKGREVRFEPTELELPGGLRFRTAYLNPGMLAFILCCALIIVYSLFI